MPAKKQSKKQEPLLNAVARKLGHAAGKLTKATQELTENLSALPETVTTRLREANVVPAELTRSRAQLTKKRIRNARRVRRAKVAAVGEIRRSPKDKSPRSSRKFSNRKK